MFAFFVLLPSNVFPPLFAYQQSHNWSTPLLHLQYYRFRHLVFHAFILFRSSQQFTFSFNHHCLLSIDKSCFQYQVESIAITPELLPDHQEFYSDTTFSLWPLGTVVSTWSSTPDLAYGSAWLTENSSTLCCIQVPLSRPSLQY